MGHNMLRVSATSDGEQSSKQILVRAARKVGHTPMPVPLVKGGRALFQKILLAFDSAGGSTQALETAVELARMSGAELHVLAVEMHLPRYPATIGEVEDAKALADQSAHALTAHAYLRALQAGVPFQSEVRAGSATRTILERAESGHIDLLVLGATARSCGCGSAIMLPARSSWSNR